MLLQIACTLLDYFKQFCWFVGRHKFQYSLLLLLLLSASFYPLVSVSISFSFSKEGQKIETNTFFFFFRTFLLLPIRFGGLFHRKAPPLVTEHTHFQQNQNKFFMCNLHTIYSDFPQFKINYASRICKIEQTIYLLFIGAIEV